MSDENPPPSESQPPTLPKPPEEVAAGDSLVAVVKKLFFVADQAGDPVVTRGGPHTVVLNWLDDSIARVHFEVRPGRHLAVGPRISDEQSIRERNQKFEDSKKLEDDRKAPAKQEAAA